MWPIKHTEKRCKQLNTWSFDSKSLSIEICFVGGFRVADYLFSFLCCHIMCLYVLSSVVWCPLRFPHKNYVRYLQLFMGCLVCVWLCVVVSETCCLCLIVCGGVRDMLFVFDCVWWCPRHVVLCFCFVCLVCPVLPVSLDYSTICGCPINVLMRFVCCKRKNNSKAK
jgi:hypothetical protein